MLSNFRKFEQSEADRIKKRDNNRHEERMEYLRLQHAKLSAKENRLRLEMEERRRIREQEVDVRRQEREEERQFLLEKLRLQYGHSNFDNRSTSTGLSSGSSVHASTSGVSQGFNWDSNSDSQYLSSHTHFP